MLTGLDYLSQKQRVSPMGSCIGAVWTAVVSVAVL